MWPLKSRKGTQSASGLRWQLKQARPTARRKHHLLIQKARLFNIHSLVDSFAARITNYHPAPLHDYDSCSFHYQVTASDIQRIKQIMETLLTNSKVRIRDPSMVERKLAMLIEGGIDKLIVISDFDYTLSRFHDASGVKCWTTHGIFDAPSTISSDLGNKVALLKAKYLPIEFDPHMSVAEKTPHMENWWKAAHSLIVDAKFTRRAMEDFVQASKIELRDEAEAMIYDLHRQHVPLIIFSAGIGNVIDTFIRKKLGMMPDNVHIISNMMDFDDEDVVIGFREPLIHTFCKNGSVVRRKRSFFREATARTNILLMGDSLGDLDMDVGVDGEIVALKIGFLNFNVDALLDNFLVGYDIVLIDDQTVHVARNIVHLIAESRVTHSQNPYSVSHSFVSNTSCRIEVTEEDQQRGGIDDTEKAVHAVVTDVTV
uniref:5'-nucleotidase n=1 Tax=Parascaris univalens TaxID=6257 RepID=A0A915C9Y4_PARUN